MPEGMTKLQEKGSEDKNMIAGRQNAETGVGGCKRPVRVDAKDR